MGSLIDQMIGRKGYLKLTWDDLAQRVHKDASTVKKQLSARGNPSLSVLEEYASAMDAEIVLLSDDARYDYKTSGVPRAQKSLADQDREIEHLKEKLDQKDDELEQARATVKRLRDQNDLLIKWIDEKDRKIYRMMDRLTEGKK